MNRIQCHEFPHELIDNLNIAQNNSTPMIVYWNKYQIFLCEDSKKLVNVCKYNCTDTVAQLVLTTKYLLCLNHSGNISLTPLKLKHSAHKRFTVDFEKRSNILVFDCAEDIVYSITRELDNLYFCINLINSEFALLKKFVINTGNLCIPSQLSRNRHRKKMIFAVRLLTETEFLYIKELFGNGENEWNKQLLVVMSFDGLSIYAVLVNEKSDQVLSPIELFKSPTQVSSINFISESCLNLILSLSSGTVVKLILNNLLQTPRIVHLNTAISKLVATEGYLIYTDGATLWKAKDTFSDTEIIFKQFNAKSIKDFIRIDDQIIYTTYLKLIYSISIEDETSYVESPSVGYYPAENVLNNSDILKNMYEEIEKNNQLHKNIKKQEHYLTALILSNRHDIMDDSIQYEITIFESYEDILKGEKHLTLTNKIRNYFDDDCVYLLIKINGVRSNLNQILTYLLQNITIHITVATGKNIKTYTIKISDQLKNLNIVVPICTKDLQKVISVNIKLVTNVPGALNSNESLWTVLHSKAVVLNQAQLQKTIKNNIVQSLHRNSKQSVNDLICQIAEHHHGNLFSIEPNLN